MGNEEEKFIRSNCRNGDDHEPKTKAVVGSELSEKHLVHVCAHQGFVLSPLLFAVAVNVITENA